MYASIMSAANIGIHSYPVRVEVDVSTGLPGMELVGLLAGEVRESKERVRVALKNAWINLPPMKITVSLAPGDLRKEGTAYDLPIAVGLLAAMEMFRKEDVENKLFLGELGLNGELRPVKGILPIAAELSGGTTFSAAESLGKDALSCASQRKSCEDSPMLVVPYENAREAASIEGIRVAGIRDIKELIDCLSASREDNPYLFKSGINGDENSLNADEESMPDFAQIHGQNGVKRAAQVAAAGFHHMLMVGPPGSGKTMIAKRIPSIMPPMSVEESLEVSKIYSVAGLLNQNMPMVTRRPFLSPHHTITMTALAGGGRTPSPGQISLAHRGVLFLDELPEFHRATIETMRQPLEDRKVHIARSQGSYSYPSDFMLVAAMNPCPCGFYPDRNRCRCTPNEIRRYLSKVSGPILDRIDITVEAPKVELEELKSDKKEESSREIRMRVLQAREIQNVRYKGTNIRFNSELNPSQIARYCRLGEAEQRFVDQVFNAFDLSARSYHRILRLSRTIADLDQSERILEKHISEAVGYKMTEQMWDTIE